MLRTLGTRPVLVVALAMVAAILLLLGRPAVARAQVTAMLPDMLKNLTYPSEYTASGFAPLRDGRYDQRAALNDPDRKSTRLNSSHVSESRMPSSA